MGDQIIVTLSDLFTGSVDLIFDVVEYTWDDVLTPALEFGLSLIGIEDVDVLSTEVYSTELNQDKDSYEKKQLQQLLSRMHNSSTGSVTADFFEMYHVGGLKLKSYYSYGESTFVDGLPDATVHLESTANSEVQQVLEEIEGTTVTIDSVILSYPTDDFTAKFYLQDKYNYSVTTNQLMYKGYLNELTSVEFNEELGSIDITITTVDYPIVQTLISIDPPDYVQHYIVEYTVSSATKLWLYEKGLGTYPTLDEGSSAITTLRMFPTVTLRNDRIDVNTDKTSERYLTSFAMLRKLGLNIDDLIAGYSVDENPNLDTLEDVFVHFAVRPNNTHPIVSKILFDQFEYSYTNIPIPDEGVNTFTATYNEGAMNYLLSWEAVEPTLITGSIGSVGTYTHEIETIEGTTPSYNLYLRKQITETSYKELQLKSLANMTLVERNGEYGACAYSPIDNRFTIPITYDFFSQYRVEEQIDLIDHSLQLTFYSADIIHLEWYETSSFVGFVQFIVYAVMTIMTVMSFGATYAANGFIIAAWNTLASIIRTIILSYTLQQVFQSTDNTTLQILAVATAAYITYGTSATGDNWYTDMLALLNATTNAVESGFTYKTQQVQEEAGKVAEEYKERSEEILAKYEALYGGILSTEDILDIFGEESEDIDPSSFDPSLFYYTAKGGLTSDMGIVLYSQVEMMKQIPTIEQTTMMSIPTSIG